MSHLTKKDRLAIRAALEAQRAQLLRGLKGVLEENGQTRFADVLGRSSGDSADEALAVTLGNLSAARMDHEVRTLQAMESAFKRLDDPEYGQCEDCGGNIPAARLIANPVAIRCVACQERFEHTHAGQTHGSM
ncbi:MAG: TraR/DksA family transcriptional regulator [Pseudomonadota bacterium]|nr:TraR/DksA family transcriptional regulator [Pseudomonadota bacterium]MDP1903028.1 TraR/DksA family transcriptional regulator [Pseudomonadota bacterium]MDP2352200.1 TraR/DksA family transcriptional regulator [Pseudomonadota bacterium]